MSVLRTEVALLVAATSLVSINSTYKANVSHQHWFHVSPVDCETSVSSSLECTSSDITPHSWCLYYVCVVMIVLNPWLPIITYLATLYTLRLILMASNSVAGSRGIYTSAL